MRISDWSSDVCSSDLPAAAHAPAASDASTKPRRPIAAGSIRVTRAASIEAVADAEREGPRQQGRAKIVGREATRVAELVIILLDLVGQVGGVEGDAQPFGDIERHLEVEALFGDAPPEFGRAP